MASFTKLTGGAVIGKSGAVRFTKLAGYAVLVPGSPPQAVAGSSSLSFSVPSADFSTLGVAGAASLSFAVGTAAVGDGGFTGVGAISGSTTLIFSPLLALADPSDFPEIIGLSSGGCPRPRLAHAICDERLASAAISCEEREAPLASADCDQRIAHYYKEE